MERRLRWTHPPQEWSKRLETCSIGVDPILSEVDLNCVTALVSFYSKLFRIHLSGSRSLRCAARRMARFAPAQPVPSLESRRVRSGPLRHECRTGRQE